MTDGLVIIGCYQWPHDSKCKKVKEASVESIDTMQGKNSN